jgi:hypothetical protein
VWFVIAYYFAVGDHSVIWDIFQFDEETCVGSWNVSNSLEEAVNTSGKASAQIPQLPLGDNSPPPGGDNAECVYPYKVYTAECNKSLTATYQCKKPIPSNKLLVNNILTNN